MIQKIFGVRDTKALAFLQPFYSTSSGAAIRAFDDAINEGGNSPLCKHPGDFVLYELGSFDDSTGELIGVDVLKVLAHGADFKKNAAVPNSAMVDTVKLNPDVVRELENANGKK